MAVKMNEFTLAGYADIVYLYGCCDDNGLKMSREYRRRFTDTR
jgi:hypothetical protein